MSEPFLGEIRLFSFGGVPRGWMRCDGQVLQINTHQALYSLVGATYGGNGVTTFALPDLRGRVPVHVGNGVTLGQKAGEEIHTLTINEMPAHNHVVNGGSESATLRAAAGHVWGATLKDTYETAQPSTQMNMQALSTTGNSQPHQNMQPFSVVNYCIAITGIYPTRN
ncbi:phage tail protein [Lysinibacillus macroides]|uniref:Tail collar protein n=1 Tax=Lysinibacillus macroides TaxID=33935 RepID=A0A0M9DK54_9BACI|nr:tail fiber protein [Lysinibacillus macroides]KOY82056.1 tail collar protein [Lysinibacillus macroides]QPR68369.1 phage tail protein [Lysinibacillus macroides]